MKKSCKKLLAVLLALVMTLTLFTVAVAAGTEEKTPIVLIPGFGQTETDVFDADGNNIGHINDFQLPGLNVENILHWLLSPALLSVITRSDVKLTSTISAFMADLFKPFAANNDGTPVYRREIERYNAPFSELSPADQATVQHHIAIHGLDEYNDVRYYFTYDSFGSIKTAADDLHDYIHNIVLAQTGASKVTLVPVSQGGTVLTQYLASYPEDYQYIKKIVCMIPAFDGSQIVGDVMRDNVTIYDINRAHEEILPALLQGDLGYQVSLALRLALSRKLTEKVLRSALESARQLLIVNSTSMWALCPAADYAVAKQTYLMDGNHDAVLAECEAYDAARAALPDTLRQLQADGKQIHIVACYDEDFLVSYLFNSRGMNSDGLLTPASSGLGVTAANLGETLGDDYVSPHTNCSDPTHNHISPDRVLDVSTGAFPENTWFFKGILHTEANFHDDLKNFAAKLIIDDSITDIYHCPGYGQFVDVAAAVDHTYVGSLVTYYYDKDGNLLYYTYNSEEKTASPIWVGLSKAVNGLFRLLDKLKIDRLNIFA